MKLPKVHLDILGPIIEEIDGPKADEFWLENMITRMREEQPVLVEYLTAQSEEIALVGLLIIRFLESQCEANEMKELFG
ncbi:hypothetical protein LCGC14_2537580 [marine sediment metagenome]|uniref:Uncharacterized protein n=1 Tax=marine sediment metagenome TaxID=412755 RepID=A0A0F9BEM9_9ZZZZ